MFSFQNDTFRISYTFFWATYNFIVTSDSTPQPSKSFPKHTVSLAVALSSLFSGLYTSYLGSSAYFSSMDFPTPLISTKTSCTTAIPTYIAHF